MGTETSPGSQEPGHARRHDRVVSGEGVQPAKVVERYDSFPPNADNSSAHATPGRDARTDFTIHRRLIDLQRLAGNAATSRIIASLGLVPHAQANIPSGSIGDVVQRIHVDLAAGGSIGDAPATNHREGVRLALDRMHVLWGIDNPTYDRIYPQVSSQAPGDRVTDAGVLTAVRAALDRTNEPVLVAPVAQAQFAAPLAGGVGTGQLNQAADVAMVQDLLEANDLLSVAAAATERRIASAGGALNAGTLPETFRGISRLKMNAVAGVGKVGWSRLIRSDEAAPGGEDRLADRTFQYGNFLVFVPSGALASLTNDVHIFFSAGGVVGDASHVEHHGLRGSAESGSRILIGVQGEQGRAFTISESEICLALESAGRPARINSITISAHSRGNQGLARTLRAHLLPSALIQHITVLDGNDQARSLLAAFAAAHIPLSNVTADIVTTGQFGTFPSSVHTVTMDPSGIRAIGYARLINDAAALGRVSPMPPEIVRKAAALRLPPRGSLTGAAAPPPGKTNINAFIRANRPALADLRTGERSVGNVQALAGSEDTSPYAFVEWNDLLNLRDASAPRRTWRSVSPGIYSHHLFVAELGRDFLS